MNTLIPNTVTSIGYGAFDGCVDLLSILIPNSITSINNYAFYGCKGLQSISIPNSVTSIGNGAFDQCEKLAFVKMERKTPISIESNVFPTRSNVILYVPVGSKSEYQSANYWKEFKEIVEYVSTYTLSINTSDGGEVTYGNSTISGTSQDYTIDEGTNVALSFSPNSGFRLKSVVVNGTDVTSSVTNNRYFISSLHQNTSVLVTFEEIPPVIYTLTITAIGGGAISYADNSFSNATQTFSVVEGTSHTLSFLPNSNYRVKSVVVNGTDVSSSVMNNQYTIGNISQDATIVVSFEEIPPTTYTLTITTIGGGSVNYVDNTITNLTQNYSVVEGTSHKLSFLPNSNYRLKSVVVNGEDMTSTVVNSQYTISNISQNTTVVVTFEEIPIPIYTMSIKAEGKGYVNYLEASMSFWGTTKEFSVKEGTSATLTFTPNSSNRLKNVVVNGADVTADVTNNRYVISNITGNTTVVVAFEEMPPTTYTLTITSIGGGSVNYVDNAITVSTQNYSVVEGSSHTLSFLPNSNYRIKSVVVNGEDVTLTVVNNQYTISDVSQNTTVVVTFEAIPPTTYTVTIIAIGNGSVTYSIGNTGSTISETAKEVSVVEGSSLVLTFTPYNGYRVKSVKVNKTLVGSNLNSYAINAITQDTTIEVEFEEIPIPTYTLSITAGGKGYVNYLEASMSFLGTTKEFSVKEGTSATLTFTPNSGNRLKSVVVNGVDVTSSITNNRYVIKNINQNTTVVVAFEEIPPTTYTFTIASMGNGSVNYAGNTVKSSTQAYTVVEGTTLILSFTPENGNYLERVVVNGTDVTASVVDGQYTISSIAQNTTIVVTFKEELKAMTVDGVNYTVTSYSRRTVNVAAGNYGRVLRVPASFEYDGKTWTVSGIDGGALVNETDLAAIVWNPDVAFTEYPKNPNILLYVKSVSYAPSTINNVVVNNVAQKITLTEADSGNDFYCPQAFTARSITYSHSYQMTTGIDKCLGWETIALPFDVQTISHASKGEIVPFAAKTNGGQKGFWLYRLSDGGWKWASAIKANTPYIISMPNNDLYYEHARLNGRITFSASDVTIPVTNANMASYGGRTFVPNFIRQAQSGTIYTLNVNNEWYSSAYGDEGSMFIANQRSVSPFEAYMTTTNGARTSFGIFEDMSTDMSDVVELIDAKRVNVYNITGQKRKMGESMTLDELKQTQPAGVYIINGQKVIVR